MPMRNKEHIFILKVAYQIPNNLNQLTWKLWPQQIAFPVNSLPTTDNQETEPSTPFLLMNKGQAVKI